MSTGGKYGSAAPNRTTATGTPRSRFPVIARYLYQIELAVATVIGTYRSMARRSERGRPLDLSVTERILDSTVAVLQEHGFEGFRM